jgi:hypothetical protein
MPCASRTLLRAVSTPYSTAAGRNIQQRTSRCARVAVLFVRAAAQHMPTWAQNGLVVVHATCSCVPSPMYEFWKLRANLLLPQHAAHNWCASSVDKVVVLVVIVGNATDVCLWERHGCMPRMYATACCCRHLLQTVLHQVSINAQYAHANTYHCVTVAYVRDFMIGCMRGCMRGCMGT